MAALLGGAGLHLDEDHGPPLDGNQVNLANPVPVSPGHNDVPQLPQELRRRIFAPLPQRPGGEPGLELRLQVRQQRHRNSPFFIRNSSFDFFPTPSPLPSPWLPWPPCRRLPSVPAA